MELFPLSVRVRQCLWGTLILMLTLRMQLSALLPLTDSTESRYAEIARKMLETGNMVTPLFDYGVPFWGKPPLSMWLSVTSMKMFGVNEFAVRLPELLLILGTLGLVWLLASRRYNRDFALISVNLTLSLPLVVVVAGVVMTDATLVLTTSLSFAAFWFALMDTNSQRSRLWGYLFFVGQGLGLLAKGPICLVLTFGPIFLWSLPRGRSQWKNIWTRLPWMTGTLLMLVISLPWYLMAEQRTPGFLSYFIIGEHFNRFLVSGWNGDKYGHPHHAPLGMIWIYWFAGTFPWSFFAASWLIRRYNTLKVLFQDRDGWSNYLLCWALFPLLFFSFAHNILWTYTLTGLPAFALLFVELWTRCTAHQNILAGESKRCWFWLRFSLPILVVLTVSLVITVFVPSLFEKNTQKYLAQYYLAHRLSADSHLSYLFMRRYSAEFYTAGQAKSFSESSSLRNFLNNSKSQDYIAVPESLTKYIPKDIISHFHYVTRINDILLFEESSLATGNDSSSGDAKK